MFRIPSLCLAAALVIPAVSLAQGKGKIPPGTYEIDPAHSRVKFEIPHLVISDVEGRFEKFEGTITVADALASSSVEAKIDVASINTANADRDKHLRSADFFDAAKYPTITFKSKRVSGNGDDLKVVGDLTMHGVTKEVTLDVDYEGDVVDATGNRKLAFEGETKFDRRDFGLKWSKMVEAGPVVGDMVKIELKLQAAAPTPTKASPKK